MSETQEETKSTFKSNRKQRFQALKLKQLIGILPTKPESRIAGKHEYIRLENVNDPYFTRIEHKLVKEVGATSCEVCSFFYTDAEEKIIEGLTTGPCDLVNNSSQLDLKLTELKAAGRKLLDIQREWGGWTIKVMA